MHWPKSRHQFPLCWVRIHAANHLTFGSHTTLQGLFLFSLPCEDFFLQFWLLVNFLPPSLPSENHLSHHENPQTLTTVYKNKVWILWSACSQCYGLWWMHRTTHSRNLLCFPSLVPLSPVRSLVHKQQLSWVSLPLSFLFLSSFPTPAGKGSQASELIPWSHEASACEHWGTALKMIKGASQLFLEKALVWTTVTFPKYLCSFLLVPTEGATSSLWYLFRKTGYYEMEGLFSNTITLGASEKKKNGHCKDQR